MSTVAPTSTITAGPGPGPTRLLPSLRRDERKRDLWAALDWKAHLVILGLSGLIWFIASGMVSERHEINGKVEVVFVLDEGLAAGYVLMPSTRQFVDLEVNGPAREFNRFASLLAENPTAFRYVLRIVEDDVKNVPARDDQFTLTRDVTSFELQGRELIPGELDVAPVGPSNKFEVRIERIIDDDVVADQPLNFFGVIEEGYTYKAEAMLRGEDELIVTGPASRLRAMKHAGDKPALNIVRTNINELITNRAGKEGKKRPDILAGKFTETFDLEIPEGVSVRRKKSGERVTQLRVSLSFEAERDFVGVSAKFPVAFMKPAWMEKKNVQIVGVDDEILVVMQVLSRQRDAFTTENVTPVLDLSRVREIDLKTLEEPEGGGPGRRRKAIYLVYIKLQINPQALTFRFARDDIKAETYLQLNEVEFVWTE